MSLVVLGILAAVLLGLPLALGLFVMAGYYVIRRSNRPVPDSSNIPLAS